MNFHLSYYLAKQRRADLHRASQRSTLATHGRHHRQTDAPVTIRRSTHADLTSLDEIAQLDSQHLPTPPFLIAEVGGEIVAALAIEAGTVLANPFRHTERVVALLRLCAEQLALTTRPARTAPRWLRGGGPLADSP